VDCVATIWIHKIWGRERSYLRVAYLGTKPEPSPSYPLYRSLGRIDITRKLKTHCKKLQIPLSCADA